MDQPKISDHQSNLSYEPSCLENDQSKHNPLLPNPVLFDHQLNPNKQKSEINTNSHMKSGSYYSTSKITLRLLVDEHYTLPSISLAPVDVPTPSQYMDHAYGVNLMIQGQEGQQIRLQNFHDNYGHVECHMNPFPNNIGYIDAQMGSMIAYPNFCGPPFPDMRPQIPFGEAKMVGDHSAINGGR
ncbi:hypothetical protein RF11_07806 [Thelohanellus kitauei]|uniref:Uncharacterized protein n=1 Tax=Thelohanellus kitauei TaxID=669202 RepID=A0A0C2MJQ6_THEKT|nr:hypothetical protein RF11_07806 [Thelohanellus kitauei]